MSASVRLPRGAAAKAVSIFLCVLLPSTPLRAQVLDCEATPSVDSVSIAMAARYEGRWSIGPTPPGDEVVNDSIIQWMAAGEVSEKLAELEERYAPEPYRIRRDEDLGRLILEGVGRIEVLIPCGPGVFGVGVISQADAVEALPQLRVEFAFDAEGVATEGAIIEAGRSAWLMTRRGG